MKHVVQLVFVLSLWFFVAVKVAGTSFASWSWWWVLLSLVPNLSLVVTHFRL